MNNKKIEEIIKELKRMVENEVLYRYDHLDITQDSANTLMKEIKAKLTQVHNSAIEGCVEMIKDEFIPPSYEGKPVLSELEMFLKQKLENLKIK